MPAAMVRLDSLTRLTTHIFFFFCNLRGCEAAASKEKMKRDRRRKQKRMRKWKRRRKWERRRKWKRRRKRKKKNEGQRSLC
jgi:Ni/Co efflux regulator RcnB